MMLEGLDHVTVISRDLAAARRFWGELLGLREGARPPFARPGIWFYLGDEPVVHVVEGEPGDGGAIDHVAFRARGLADTAARLASAGVATRYQRVPALALQQLFLSDPDGATVELTFGADETPPPGVED